MFFASTLDPNYVHYHKKIAGDEAAAEKVEEALKPFERDFPQNLLVSYSYKSAESSLKDSNYE